MRLLPALFSLALLAPVSVSASLITTFDPDSYVLGTNLSEVVSGVHVTSFSGDAVYAAAPYLGAAPTGNLVFGRGWSWMPGSGFGLHNNLFSDNYLFRSADHALLVHFDLPTSYVSVLGYGTSFAQIWAYDSGGNLLGISVENTLSPKNALYFSEAAYTSSSDNISYALIGGFDSTNIEIDNLRYIAAVPLPASIGLFVGGLLSMALMRARKWIMSMCQAALLR